ncbi:MAG: hypothetical protein PHX93_01120 [Candidatus Peribacteraceae bacterium]|jgi:hypothetical protein|nr:hypothetical protein [Candidatus Peribacteraceae bacterium]
MKNELRILDPVLNVQLGNLDKATAVYPDASSETKRAERICALSRDIRFRLGPSWSNSPAVTESIAEKLCSAASTVTGTHESAEKRAFVAHTLQRAIFLIQGLFSTTETPWWSKVEALQKKKQQTTAA